MKPSVFLTRRLPDPVMDRLAEVSDLAFNDADRTLSRGEVIAGLGQRAALLCNIGDAIDAEVLASSARLKVVANFGVGFNNIDVAAATTRGIAVTNTPGVLTEATADIAFGLLIAAARRFSEGEAHVRAGLWTGWQPMQLLGSDLFGATLGLMGFGRIGQATARRAKGFGMRVIYWNRTRLSPERERALGVEYAEQDELLAASDFVSLHMAYAPETHHLIDALALARMKPTAVLVNTARGAVIDEKALVAALQEKTIASAGLDVFEREPKIEPALLTLKNCVVLPHLGSATTGTRTRMGMMVIDNMLAACAGELPPNCVNPEVYAKR